MSKILITFILVALAVLSDKVHSQMIAPCVFNSPTEAKLYNLTTITQIFQVKKKYDTNWVFTVGICRGVGVNCNGISNFKSIEQWINGQTTCTNQASNDLADVQMDKPLLGGLVLWYLQGAPLPTFVVLSSLFSEKIIQ